MKNILVITPEIHVPLTELAFSYARSSGPGGQNVNKVNSKAVLRWNIVESPSLPSDIKIWILGRLIPRPNSEGEIVIASDRFRDQTRNREDCLEKLKNCLAAAAFRPKRRKKTKPSFSSQRKVKESKSKHSRKKAMRRVSRDYD